MQPDNVLALNNLAWLLQDTAPDEALGYAEHANMLAPGVPSIMDTLGWLLLKHEKAGQAAVFLEEASRKAPENPQYRYHLALALDRLGRRAEAKPMLEQLLSDERLAGEHTRIRQMLGATNN